MIAQGELVYASDILSANSEPTYSGTMPSGADWIQDYIGNDGMFYTHRESGEGLFYGHFTCGAFGGGKFRIKKWVNNGWNETISNWDFGWNANTEKTWTSTGPGLYRVYSETAFAMNDIPWRVYCGQISGISRGDPIILYDDFRSSLNTITTDVKITAAYANSQRMGA